MSTLSTILVAVLAITFFGAGIAKLTGQQRMVDNFERFGLPRPVLVATGSLELLAAATLLAGLAEQALAITGALLIVVVMIGALWMHMRVKDPVAMWVAPAVLLVLALALLVSLLPES